MRWYNNFVNKEYKRIFGAPRQCEHRTPMYVVAVPKDGGVNLISPLGELSVLVNSTIETPTQIAVFSGDPHKALCDLLQKVATPTSPKEIKGYNTEQ